MAFLERNANRGSVSTGYDIDNSLKFESDNTENLTRTPSSASNQKTWTWSGWVKYTEPDLSPQTLWAGGTGSGDGSFNFRIDAGQISINTASTALRESIAKFRDPSAWYHFVMVMDTTQGTANDRIKVYVNNSQITDFSTTNNPSQNADMGVNSAQLHALGRRSNAADRYFSGYMAEVNFVDGTALTPTDFGQYDEDSGIWKPKQYTGTYGTNGFYLDFSDSANLGDDASGNSNDFTETNITAADQATDTPTNNFCTLNPLWVYGNALTTGPIEGATKVSGGGWAGTKATMGVDKGKWYYEFKAGNSSSIFGIQTDEGVALTGNAHNIISTCALYLDGEVWIKDSTSGRNDTDVTHTFSSSSIYGVAINMDNNQISFYQDGSLITNGGNIALDGLSDKTVFPFASNYNSTQEFNFGGYTSFTISSAAADSNGYGTFEYAPPSGYYALCTKNLAEYG